VHARKKRAKHVIPAQAGIVGGDEANTFRAVRRTDDPGLRRGDKNEAAARRLLFCWPTIRA